MSTNSTDPEKIAKAVADVETEIAKREYVVGALTHMIEEEQSWITFLRNTRIPALNALILGLDVPTEES